MTTRHSNTAGVDLARAAAGKTPQSRCFAAGVGVALLSLGLGACVAAPVATPPGSSPAAANRCLLPNERPMLIAELFLGRNVGGRRPLTDREWAEFARDAVTPEFPAGFTVLDGEGQWQNPATGAIGRERTKILLVAAARSPDVAARLAAVSEAYKSRFHQQSVGIITRDACAAF